MGMHPLKRSDDGHAVAETPEDVAILYSWANLEGAKYWDFSSNRREYRAQMRHRAAEQLRLMELRAQSEAEAAAVKAEAGAAAAHADAEAASVRLAAGRTTPRLGTAEEEEQMEHLRRSSLREAAQQARRAAAERLEAARRAEAAAMADSIARREEREIAEAQASVFRQAAHHAESEARNPKSRTVLRDRIKAKRFTGHYDSPEMVDSDYREISGTPVIELESSRSKALLESGESAVFSPRLRIASSVTDMGPGPRTLSEGSIEAELHHQPQPIAEGRHFVSPDQERRSDDLSALQPHAKSNAADHANGSHTAPHGLKAVPSISYREFQRISAGRTLTKPPEVVTRIETAPSEPERRLPPMPSRSSAIEVPVDESGPAWLYPKATTPRVGKTPAKSVTLSPIQEPGKIATPELARMPTQQLKEFQRKALNAPVDNALQHSQEQVTPRWFALKSAFANDVDETSDRPSLRDTNATPFVFVHSLAGGVGKTSLVATLGRALSSLGEQVLLADASSYGLLPFYFGAKELRAGVVRTFSPPKGTADATIHVFTCDLDSGNKEQTTTVSEARGKMVEDLLANGQHTHRVLIDLSVNNKWVMERLAWTKPTILVPLTADMNSILSLRAIEKSVSGMHDAEGSALQPVYLLNQFDASLPLHQDVREVLKQQLGDRLLPLVIRRAPGVSEALAEGMTIVDYAPASEAARDYLDVASWLRTVSAPATMAFKGLRWSER